MEIVSHNLIIVDNLCVLPVLQGTLYIELQTLASTIQSRGSFNGAIGISCSGAHLGCIRIASSILLRMNDLCCLEIGNTLQSARNIADI